MGYSMGGYGALLLAERLGQTRAVAVAAASPAIFASYAEARAADQAAFDDGADFARNDVFAGIAGLRGVDCLITCGDIDPFAAITQRFLAKLHDQASAPPAGGIEPGCHDSAFWARGAPAQLQFFDRR